MNTALTRHWWLTSGGSDPFDPMDLSPEPSLWVDAINGDYVSTVDNNGTRSRGNIIDSATAETGQSLTNAGTLAAKPIFNGEGWYVETGSQTQTGSLGDYNGLHNGGDFHLFFTFRQTPGTGLRVLFTTMGFSNTNVGAMLYQEGGAIKARLGNGTSSVISRDIAGVISANNTYTVEWQKVGNVHTWFINGTQVSQVTSVLSYSSSNHVQVMTISGINAAASTHYFKDFVVFTRSLTVDEITQMRARTFLSITPEDMNVFLTGGDSNDAGRGLNSAIASDLNGVISGAYAPRFNSNTPDASTWVGKLQLGVNQTLISESPSTQHGFEMRFCKSIGALKDLFLIKYGIGSTPLVQNGSVDWNIASTNENFVRFRDNVLPEALKDLVHVYRKIPVFRGFIWEHGANDAVIGGSGVSWSRSVTTITVTETSHGMSTGQTIPVTVSSDTGAIPLGIKTITSTGANTYTFTGVNTGATSGTLSYSAGSTFKTNFTALFNAIIDYLNNTIVNQVTGTTGYSTAKLRLLIVRTYGTASSLDATSYADVRAAAIDIGDNYLTDNPSYVGKVAGSTWIDLDSYSMGDGLHRNAAGYDSEGQAMANYYDDFINE